MDNLDLYLKPALWGQSQCRTTWEALAIVGAVDRTEDRGR
jgi:hypothetical protein